MKKKFNGKKIVSLFLALTLCLGAFMIPSQEVNAASPTFYSTNNKIFLLKNTTYGYFVNNPTKKDKITNIKVADKKILKAYRHSDTKYEICLVPKKAGTTKVTFKYGKKTFSMKVTVQKWVNPCKTLKLGNKNYASKFKNDQYYWFSKPSKTKKVKLSVKANKGWTLKSITYNNGSSPSYKKIKNNSTIKLPSNKNTYISVLFCNKKTGELVHISLFN